MKKGVFFSLGVMIALIGLIGVVFIIYDYNLQSKQRVLETGVSDRVFDLDSSIQNSLREIFELDSRIKIETNNNTETINFTEDLPNSNSATFRNTNINFENYVESTNKNNPTIEMNHTKFTQDLPLHIISHDIIYTHSNSFGGNEIDIIPEQVNMEGYYIEIYVPNANVQDIVWSKLNACSKANETDCIVFEIYAEGENGQPKSSIQLLKGRKESEFDIKLNTLNDITVNINEPGKINIKNNDPTTINVLTSINLSKSEERIEVNYPEDVIDISLLELNIKKSSTAKIL